MRVFLLLLFPVLLFAQYDNAGNYYDDYVETDRPDPEPVDYYQEYFADTQDSPTDNAGYDEYGTTYSSYGTSATPAETTPEIAVPINSAPQPSASNLVPSQPMNTLPTMQNLDTIVQQAYIPGYKTYNPKKMKSPRIPSLVPADGFLSNLNKSQWFLKYTSQNASALYNGLTLGFDKNTLKITALDAYDLPIQVNELYLTPIKMLKPTEGIFAYTTKNGQVHFLYMHLILPHMLAVEMTDSFEEAEKSANKKLEDLGVFILT